MRIISSHQPGSFPLSLPLSGLHTAQHMSGTRDDITAVQFGAARCLSLVKPSHPLPLKPDCHSKAAEGVFSKTPMWSSIKTRPRAEWEDQYPSHIFSLDDS